MEELKQALAQAQIAIADEALIAYLEQLELTEEDLTPDLIAQIIEDLQRSLPAPVEPKAKRKKGGLAKTSTGGLGQQPAAQQPTQQPPQAQQGGPPRTGLQQSAAVTDQELRQLDQIVSEYAYNKAAHHGQAWVQAIRSTPDLAFQIAAEVSAQEVADVDRFRPTLDAIFGSFATL